MVRIAYIDRRILLRQHCRRSGISTRPAGETEVHDRLLQLALKTRREREPGTYVERAVDDARAVIDDGPLLSRRDELRLGRGVNAQLERHEPIPQRQVETKTPDLLRELAHKLVFNVLSPADTMAHRSGPVPIPHAPSRTRTGRFLRRRSC